MDSILSKIKKCMSLAKSVNENEAAIALRQAQRLMEKHGVSTDDVALADVKAARRKAGRTRTPPNYHAMLVNLISDAFGVETLYSEGLISDDLFVTFIGIGVEAEVAAYAYDVLFRQLKRDRSLYLKTHLKSYSRTDKSRKADLFAEGWLIPVWNKVKALQRPKDETELIQRYKGANWPILREYDGRGEHKVKPNDYRDTVAGYESGAKANLHRGVGKNNLGLIGVDK